MVNYIVVLFKNNKKKKLLKTFKTERHAMNLFNKMIKKSNEVIFNKEFECSRPCKYELALLKRKTGNEDVVYVKDNMGRNIRLELDDNEFTLVKLIPFKREEMIFDLQTNQRITLLEFVNTYLNNDSLNMISSLNHKIITQTNDQVFLFSLKTMDEAERFLKIIGDYSIANGLANMTVKDLDTIHRKYLYEILEKKGFSKTMLYKQSTNHPGSK